MKMNVSLHRNIKPMVILLYINSKNLVHPVTSYQGLSCQLLCSIISM